MSQLLLLKNSVWEVGMATDKDFLTQPKLPSPPCPPLLPKADREQRARKHRRWVVGGRAPEHQLGEVEGSSRKGACGKPVPGGDTVYLPHTESNEEGISLLVQWLKLCFPMGASLILGQGGS